MAPSTSVVRSTTQLAASPAITKSPFTHYPDLDERQAGTEGGHTDCDGMGYFTCGQGTCYSGDNGFIGCCTLSYCAPQTTCIPYDPSSSAANCNSDTGGCLSCTTGNSECVVLSNAVEDQFFWFCGIEATTITYEYFNLITTGIVEPVGPASAAATTTAQNSVPPSTATNAGTEAPPSVSVEPAPIYVPPSSRLNTKSSLPSSFASSTTASTASLMYLPSSITTATSSPSTSLSNGVIAGIAVAAVLAATFLLSGLYLILQHLRRKRIREHERRYPRGTLGGAVAPGTPEGEHHSHSLAQEKAPERREASPVRSFRSKFLGASLTPRKASRDVLIESSKNASPVQSEHPHSPELDGSNMICEMPATRSSPQAGHEKPEMDADQQRSPLRKIAPPSPPLSNLSSPQHTPGPLSPVSLARTISFHRPDPSPVQTGRMSQTTPELGLTTAAAPPPISPVVSESQWLGVPRCSGASAQASRSDRVESMMSARGSWSGYMSAEQALAGGWRDDGGADENDGGKRRGRRR